MASSKEPKIQTFLADAAIAKGKAVKLGTDFQHVAVCSAATDKSFGILQSAPGGAEAACEVAMPGGGAKALAGGSIATGDLLAPDSNGALVATTTENDRVVAIALQDAVANDIFNVDVVIAVH